MADKIIADTDKLRDYARQIEKQVENLRIINNRLCYIKIDIHTSIAEKEKAIRIGNLSAHRSNLMSCSNYLKAVAEDIENIEYNLAKVDILNFSKVTAFINAGSFNSSLWVSMSKEDKKLYWDALEEIIGHINGDVKEYIDSLTLLVEILKDPEKNPNEILSHGIDLLSQYLGERIPGVLPKLGISAFGNMLENTPEAILKGSKIFNKGNGIYDVESWLEYGSYLGEHIVVDGILETAADTIDGVIDIGTGLLNHYFNVDIDFSLDDMYKDAFGKGGIEGYKDGMKELGSTLFGYASETYYKDADSFGDYCAGTVELFKDGCACFGNFVSDLF